MLCIACNGLLSGTGGKHLDKTQEGFGIVFGNSAIGARIVLVGAKRALGDHESAAQLFIPVEQSKFDQIRSAPTAQLLEPLELPLVLSAPACWVGRLCGSLEFYESARGRSLPHKRNIGTADAWVQIFWHHGQLWCCWNERKKPFEQLLKCGSQCRLWNIRVCPAKVSNALRVYLQELGDTHASRQSSPGAHSGLQSEDQATSRCSPLFAPPSRRYMSVNGLAL